MTTFPDMPQKSTLAGCSSVGILLDYKIEPLDHFDRLKLMK